MTIPKVSKTQCKGSWISCETIIGQERYDIQLTDWQNGEGSDLHVSCGKDDYTIPMHSEALAALRILLKEHGGLGKKEWFADSDINAC